MLDLPAVVVLRGRERVTYQVPTDWRLGFDGAAADFVDGLLEGRQPAQDVQAARRMLQVPLAIYESGRTGRAVAPESME
jgi:predicted dehydrogenase